MTTDLFDAAAVERRLQAAPDAPFWRALQAGEVRLPRCSRCRAWVWPARPACPTCRVLDFDWQPVEPNGTIFSFTRTWYPFVQARADALPYVVVVVELAHAGDARMIGVLEGAEVGLRIGSPVVGSIAPPGPHSYGLPTLVWRLAGGSDEPV